MCNSLRRRLSCAAALRGNWALRSVLFRRTCRIRPCGRTRRCTSFAVGRRRCRRYRRCRRRMLPSCGASIHAGSTGRLRRAAGLLGRNVVLLRDLGGAIRRNARCLLHGLGIASADGRALCSCRTGYWRILRTARLLRPQAISCGVAGRCGTGSICRMGSWLFSCRTVWRGSWRCAAVWYRRISCHTGSRRNRRGWMFCCRLLSTCHVRSLHKGAALLRGFGLYRLPLCVAAVIRLSCGTGRLNGSARWILACRFSCRTERNRASMILCRCAAARMGFRLGMYGLFLLRVLRDRAAHDRLRSSCGMIRRTGRGFGCRGRCMVLRRCHVARCTSGAGRYGGFSRGIRLFAISGRRSLREYACHLLGGGLYSIRLHRSRFLRRCRIRAVLLRRRAMMIAVCV